MDMSDRRPLWAEIDLDALVNNIKEIRKATQPDALITAVVKADGYGCGSTIVAKEVLKNGADRLAVSALDEAVELRQAGITEPILILGQTSGKRAAELIAYGVDACVFQLAEAEAFSAEAVRQNRDVHLHIGIDSGMGRIGYKPTEESVAIIKEISELPNVRLEGIFTHFCTADSADKTFTNEQYKRFRWICDRLAAEKVPIHLHHCSNSAAILELPEYHWDMVRAGIILYGLEPSPEVNIKPFHLKPVMSLKCQICYIKEIEKGDSVSYGRTFIAKGPTKIATLPVGYADGYSRIMSNRIQVLVHGQRAPQVGNICMDQCMIDISGIDDVKEGDEVVLFGQQDGAILPVEELSDTLNTINYEVVCAISRRVPRVYMRDGKPVMRREYLFD